jgi:hypothetical protein
MTERPREPFRPGHYQTPQTPTRPKLPTYPRRDCYDWITLWTAIFGVVLICIGTGITAYQATVMRDELRSVARQQRAWIRIDASDPRLHFDEDGNVAILANVRLSNVGTIPSNLVRTNSNLTPISLYGDPGEYTESIAACPNFHIGGGYTLFPGESTEFLEAAFNILDSEDPQEFLFTVCAYYDIGDGQLHGLTTARYTLTNQTGGGFQVNMKDVPSSKITLERYFDVEPAE